MRHVEHIQLAHHWGTPHPDSMSVPIRGRPSSYVPLGNGASGRAGAAMAKAAVNSPQPRTCGRLRTLTSRTSARNSRIMLSSFMSAALNGRMGPVGPCTNQRPMHEPMHEPGVLKAKRGCLRRAGNVCGLSPIPGAGRRRRGRRQILRRQHVLWRWQRQWNRRSHLVGAHSTLARSLPRPHPGPLAAGLPAHAPIAHFPLSCTPL